MINHVVKTGLLTAMALGLALGCAKTNIREDDPQDTLILSASVSDQETKTMLGAPSEGVCEVLWKTGDRVSVNGTLSDNAVRQERTVPKTLTLPSAHPCRRPIKYSIQVQLQPM